ncbi:MAG: hypothetical protein KAG97_13250 [Victivallales bacterium]|nr:hypothetical protein [Victivallales bacterium]
MNDVTMTALGQIGAFAVIAFSAVGSALGTGFGCAAAIGAWKKCYAQNKPAPFLLIGLAGAPFSQTIYGIVAMYLMFPSFESKGVGYWPFYLAIGVLAGLAIGYSALMQGKAAAGACSAFVDTEKGFANYLIALGVIETVAIFVLVFLIVIMGKLPDEKSLSKSAGGVTNLPAKVQTQPAGVIGK